MRSTRGISLVDRDDLIPIRESLEELCDQSLAVEIVMNSGKTVDAVLLVRGQTNILFESWNIGSDVPSGDLLVLDLSEVAEIRVY